MKIERSACIVLLGGMVWGLTDPVQAKAVTDAEALDPGQIFVEKPSPPGPDSALEVAGKQTDDQCQVAQRYQKARPAAQMRPAGEDQGQKASQKRKE